MDLDGELHDIQGDILALEKETRALQEEKARLQKMLLQTGSTQIEDDVPIIKHSHFDTSIGQFFGNGDSEPKRRRTRSKEDVFHRAELTVELKENILYENIYRIGGITAFPLNQYLFEDDDEVLGLRFDMFSHTKQTFLTPHYVILRKISTSNKQTETTKQTWSVFKSTLPVFVPVDDYAAPLATADDEDTALTEFSTRIRSFLTKLQYRHDKFDQLLSLKFSQFGIESNTTLITNLDKDLQAQRVTLSIAHRVSKQHLMELICSDNIIEVVHINGEEAPLEQYLKDTNIKDLLKNFRRLIQELIDQNRI